MIDTARVRRQFNRAAATYDSAAVLQRELTARLLENFEFIKIAPSMIVDVGCGTGAALPGLYAQFPQAQIVALDLAEAMVQHACARKIEKNFPTKGQNWRRRYEEHAPLQVSMFARAKSALAAVNPFSGSPYVPVRGVCANFSALPFAAGAIDVIVSNFALHWSPDLSATLRELSRVLRVGGLLIFTVPGPDTLKELRRATTSVHAFPDMHDVGDMMVAAGLADPVIARDDVTLTYATPDALLADMKALGVTFAAHDAPRGLMGKRALQALKSRLEAQRSSAHDNLIPASYEVVTAHAWKVAPRTTADGHAIVNFNPRPRLR